MEKECAESAPIVQDPQGVSLIQCLNIMSSFVLKIANLQRQCSLVTGYDFSYYYSMFLSEYLPTSYISKQAITIIII